MSYITLYIDTSIYIYMYDLINFMLRSIYAYNIIIILHYPINILEVSVMQSKVLILHDQTPCLFVALNQRSLWIRIETKLQRCENHQLPSSHDRILRSQSELHPQCFDVFSRAVEQKH